MTEKSIIIYNLLLILIYFLCKNCNLYKAPPPFSLFLRVVALVFLFLIWLHFPYLKSVAKVIQKRYGENTVMRLRKLKNLDYQFWEAHIHLQFLVNCNSNSLVPKFLNFCRDINS